MTPEPAVAMLNIMQSTVPFTVSTEAGRVTPSRTDTRPTGELTRPSRALAKVAGGLFLAATVAAVIGGSLVDSVVGGAGNLANVSAHQDRMIAGATLELIAAFASAGIGIALYPVVRRHAVALALGSAGFRIIEGTLYLVGAIGTLLLLKLGQEYTRAGAHPSASFQTTEALLRTLRDDAALTGLLAFYLGAGMYYYVFYIARVLPGWLTAWGLAGVALGAAAGLLVLFGITTLGSGLHTALNLPIGVQELVLAIWLIFVGFSSQPAPVTPAGVNAGRQQ